MISSGKLDVDTAWRTPWKKLEMFMDCIYKKQELLALRQLNRKVALTKSPKRRTTASSSLLTPILHLMHGSIYLNNPQGLLRHSMISLHLSWGMKTTQLPHTFRDS